MRELTQFFELLALCRVLENEADGGDTWREGKDGH